MGLEIDAVAARLHLFYAVMPFTINDFMLRHILSALRRQGFAE